MIATDRPSSLREAILACRTAAPSRSPVSMAASKMPFGSIVNRALTLKSGAQMIGLPPVTAIVAPDT